MPGHYIGSYGDLPEPALYVPTDGILELRITIRAIHHRRADLGRQDGRSVLLRQSTEPGPESVLAQQSREVTEDRALERLLPAHVGILLKELEQPPLPLIDFQRDVVGEFGQRSLGLA